MKNATCKTCDSCKQLYQRLLWSHFGTRLFYCMRKEKIIGRNEFCPEWSKRRSASDISPERLREAEENVLYLCEKLKNEDVLI